MRLKKKIFIAYNNFQRIRETQAFKLVLLTIIIGLLASLVIYLIEIPYGDQRQIKSYDDAMWYTIVTLSTTGYGDLVPIGPEGRIIGGIIIVISFFLTAVASGLITSIFVEKKMKEGRGLKPIKWKDHIVVCGWNNYGIAVLKSIFHASNGKQLNIVLVNELQEEEISHLISEFREMNVQFVKGNIVNEFVLKRAGIERAESAILMADTSGSNTIDNADERTILTALAIKSLNSKIKTSAQIIKEESEPHLKRAEIDEIIVDGEFSGYLISNAAISPGIHQLLKELLSFSEGNTLIKSIIPRTMVGKNFHELSLYFAEKRQAILIGIMTENTEMSLDDIISDDYSAIDEFIRRKFAEAEDSLLEGQKNRLNIKINPGADYVIQKNDVAFVITTNLDQVAS